jgi:hypothetical protein
MQICIFDWETSGNYLHKHLQCRHNKTCFLFSFGKSFASLGTMQYICAAGNLYHGRMAQWSAARRHSADALEFESLSTQIILDWIGLDWIVLHTNENTESMVKGRIDPSALPNSRRINPTSVIMWLV